MDQFIIIFIDDILSYSKSEVEHTGNFVLTLETLRQHKLFVKILKCEFWLTHKTFLGHVLSKKGIIIDPQNVQVIYAGTRKDSDTTY